MKLIYEVLNVLFLKLLHLHFFTLAVSFNHAECSKRTHSSLEFNSPFHCGLCSSAVSLTRSSSHAKITELPTWQRGDYGFCHYRHGNMSWECELPV